MSTFYALHLFYIIYPNRFVKMFKGVVLSWQMPFTNLNQEEEPDFVYFGEYVWNTTIGDSVFPLLIMLAQI